jgi:hypothetical protein
MELINYLQNTAPTSTLLIASFTLIGSIVAAKILFSKEDNEEDKNINQRPIIKSTKSSENKQTLVLLEELIKQKFEFYLYKDILPVYIGNENTKKEKFKKEKFMALKKFFYSDLLNSLSEEQLNEVYKLFTQTGFEIFIHQKFSIAFNKVDAKFLNKEEDLKENMFFMSDKIQN